MTYLIGFVRPDGTLLVDENCFDHSSLARKDLSNKKNFPFLRDFEEDPSFSSAINLIHAGYIQFTRSDFILPNNPTEQLVKGFIEYYSQLDPGYALIAYGGKLSALEFLLEHIPDLPNNHKLNLLRGWVKHLIEEITHDTAR